MIDLNHTITASSLQPKIDRLWELSAAKIRSIEADYDASRGAPVYTVEGRYVARGWTEWTQGFQFGSSILQFDATHEGEFLDHGRNQTVSRMAAHVTHTGVHDHGFNSVSTYGNLLRLHAEGRLEEDPWQRKFYEMALKCSGAVQAMRWTGLPDGGFVYSFNGPHSLFADTIRSMRVLALAHQLGHVLSGENDVRISLLHRLLQHVEATARYNVYYGEMRDGYDVRGRVAHESIFNLNDGRYRCPNSQQGYSPFSTWTRGLAWILCGFAELLEWLATVPEDELIEHGGRESVDALMMRVARATADFYIESTPACGIPYWDTGAPNLHRLGDYRNQPADPFNDVEPVDSSAAAIAVQGFLRLGRFLQQRGDDDGNRYLQAGLRLLDTLLSEPYLSTDTAHQGLILHAVYHWPNRWDHVPKNRNVACGESTMWGDYHAREAALYVQRIVRDEPYVTFFPDKAATERSATAS